MPPAGPSHSLTLAAAQTLAVLKQGLASRPASADKETLLDVVRRIGLLQLDSIHVVARSHYLVMLSRVGLYDARDLDALLYPDRRLFEQWGHAACLIPAEHYRYFAPAMQARRGRRHDALARLEPGIEADEELAADISGALHEFARFHGCNSIHVERCEPAVLKDLL